MSPRWLRRARKVARGYTIVELLMSLTVLAFGASGVIAMQKVTLASNRNAKNLSLATRIAQGWADQLTADASLWFPGTSPLAATTWLSGVETNTDWFIPAFSTERAFGPAFDALGSPIDADDRPGAAHFCTHLRLAYMQSETAATTGNDAIRAQIRIFWRRDDGTADPPGADKPCDVTGTELTDNQDQLNVLYLTTSVRESRRTY